MIDIVYTLGSGSHWNNNELRYSLRSVDMHLWGIRNVIVIGEKPDFLTNVIHIPFKDKWYKERNILEKLLYVCKQDFVTDDFLFMNDDHFLLRGNKAEYYPFYYDGTLSEATRKRGNDLYRTVLSGTHRVLYNDGLSTNHFDVHTPIVYNKRYFPYIMCGYDWTMAYGYAIKSLYANNLEVKGEPITDCKINSPACLTQLEIIASTRPVFSVGDYGLTDTVKTFLQDLYPVKSYYEL